MEIRRWPKTRVGEKTLMDWLDKETTCAMMPSAGEISAKCRKLKQPNANGIKVTSEKKLLQPIPLTF